MTEYLIQIENMPLLEARYEVPLIESFHFGDREFDCHFSHMLPILNGLHSLGWKIELEQGFRVHQILVDEWYVDIMQGRDELSPVDDSSVLAENMMASNLDRRRPQQLNLLSESESLIASEPVRSEFDWFELEVGVKVRGESINLMPYIVTLIQREELDFYSVADGAKLQIKLDSGQTISLDRERVVSIFSSFVELNDEKSLNREQRLRFPSNQFGRLIPLLDIDSSTQKKKNIDKPFAMSWASGKKLAKKAKQLSMDRKISKIAVPRELHGELRDYQQCGLNWLQFIRRHHLGGILADDMGLGKTIQTIAHILVEKKSGRLKAPCLVIAPTSLLSNWQQETNKFAPTLKFMKLAGSKRQSLFSKLSSMDIVVTSYGLVLRDINILRKTRFHLLILDEAQVIKNTRSKITSVVNALSSNQRLCLTGTPMENHLGELWSLFQFLMPNFLGSEYQFNQLYRQPIEKNQDYHRQGLLAKRVAPLMLRRTKNEVAKELPSKTEIMTLIELEENQADLYETIRVSMMEQVSKAMLLESKNRNNFLIGNALLKLRQVCCHSNLIKLDSAQKLNSSAKISWLKTRLPSMVEQGRRILLFSSFTSMLDIIAEELTEMSISYLMLTGKTKQRGRLVEQFQKSKVPIFLISLKAGGVGLNLTAADTVIHFDPWWNPAAEQQANDRAYRIGQDKPVFVYKLITKGTVEEKIQQMQQQKHKLAQGLYDQESLDTLNLTSEDWQALFQPIEGF
ncbi:MAG: DEAD/DEAH box helicase [Enterobacterales bacterium]|nr:DEAD/DEAH box helicase [Enterobacterales bacterium]